MKTISHTVSAASIALLLLPLALRAEAPASSPASAPAKVVSITEIGATPEAASNTAAIQKAIDTLAAAGGGTVRVPAGKFTTGPLTLKSNITLQLDKGATLFFAYAPEQHAIVKTRWESTSCYNLQALIHADGAKNTAITGEGTLDGNGKPWWEWTKDARKTMTRLRASGNTDEKAEDRRFTAADHLRPNFITLANCDGIRIEGITIENSPMWTIHPLLSENIVIRGVTIRTHGPNTDGIDPESCKNVLIEKCDIDSGDDCIAIKSGRDKDGRRVGRPTENLMVRDCIMRKGHAGVALGSETAGGIRDVTVAHCTFIGSDRGIRLKTMRGRGGVVERITFDHITMKDIRDQAIILTLNYEKTDPEPVSERTPAIKDVAISDVTCDGAKRAVVIDGLPERPIEGVTLKNVTIKANAGLTCARGKKIALENVKITPAAGEPMTFQDSTEVTVDGKTR